MPRRFDLETMVSYCKRRCDMEGQLSISDAEWKFMIGTVWAELTSEVSATGMRYFETTANKTIDGTDWAEPSNHLSTVGVDEIMPGGRRRALYEAMAQERNRWSGITGASAVAYAIVDDVIKLYPTPPNGQVYQIIYIQQPHQLHELADDYVIDVVTPDGEAFLLWGVAVAAIHKRDGDVSVARAEKEAARERLRNWAVMRSMHAPRRRMSMDAEMFGESDWEIVG